MPKGSAWINFVYVNLGFMLQVFAMYFFTKIKEIKDHWPEYRCNPMYMPLADDIGSNFVYCIQNMQMNFMGFLLQPLQYIMSSLGNMSFGMLGDIGNIRSMIGYLRDSISSITGNIFTVFLNIVIEFQKIILGFKDIIGKIVGIVVTVMYVLDGGLKTMNSTWNGPPGQMVKALGSCFHPETKIKLKNGEIVEMQHLNLGDVLDNGSIVRALMKIDNSTNETIYKFEKKGIINKNGDNEDIYVTGSHYVLGDDNKWIQVKNDPNAQLFIDTKIENMKNVKKVENLETVDKKEKNLTSWFSCLITNDHKIQIGSKTFWDWEDYDIKTKIDKIIYQKNVNQFFTQNKIFF